MQKKGLTGTNRVLKSFLHKVTVVLVGSRLVFNGLRETKIVEPSRGERVAGRTLCVGEGESVPAGAGHVVDGPLMTR